MTSFTLLDRQVPLKDQLSELTLEDFMVIANLDPTDETEYILSMISQLSGISQDEIQDLLIEDYGIIRDLIVTMFAESDDSLQPDLLEVGGLQFMVKPTTKLSMREMNIIKLSTNQNGAIGAIPDILAVLVCPYTENKGENGEIIRTPNKFSIDAIDGRKEFFRTNLRYPEIRKIVGFFENGNLS